MVALNLKDLNRDCIFILNGSLDYVRKKMLVFMNAYKHFDSDIHFRLVERNVNVPDSTLLEEYRNDDDTIIFKVEHLNNI